MSMTLALYLMLASTSIPGSTATIRFTGRIVAPSCSLRERPDGTAPDLACPYVTPPRVTRQRRPEPQPGVTRDDTVYVLTYD
jgi:hypothetical protein